MKKLIIPMMGIAMLCFASSCSKEEDCCQPEIIPEINVVTNIDNQLLLKLVNDLRSTGCNCGDTFMPPVGALNWNTYLSSAALSHSNYMDSVNVMKHESDDGKTVAYRVSQTGYTWITVGENIAWGYKNEKEVFKGWLYSEAHCKNMMNASYKEMGAAKSGLYWTKVFAATK